MKHCKRQTFAWGEKRRRNLDSIIVEQRSIKTFVSNHLQRKVRVATAPLACCPFVFHTMPLEVDTCASETDSNYFL